MDITASAICDAALRVVNSNGSGGVEMDAVKQQIKAPAVLTQMALDLLLACGQIATSGCDSKPASARVYLQRQ